FFFQADDGIRDRNVTGVQTCALPIFPPAGTPNGCHPIRNRSDWARPLPQWCAVRIHTSWGDSLLMEKCLDRGGVCPDAALSKARSEERRVGKECMYELWQDAGVRRKV